MKSNNHEGQLQATKQKYQSSDINALKSEETKELAVAGERKSLKNNSYRLSQFKNSQKNKQLRNSNSIFPIEILSPSFKKSKDSLKKHLQNQPIKKLRRKKTSNDNLEEEVLNSRRILDNHNNMRKSLIADILPRNFNRDEHQEGEAPFQNSQQNIGKMSVLKKIESIEEDEQYNDSRTQFVPLPESIKRKSELFQPIKRESDVTPKLNLQRVNLTKKKTTPPVDDHLYTDMQTKLDKLKKVKTYGTITENPLVQESNRLLNSNRKSQTSSPGKGFIALTKINSEQQKKQARNSSHSPSRKSMMFNAQMKDLLKRYLHRSNSIMEKLEKQGSKEVTSKYKRSSSSGSYSPIHVNTEISPENRFGDDETIEAKAYQQPFILKMNDKFRIRWDLFVMLLAIFNCYQLPFDVAFDPSIFNQTLFKIINSCIDFCFLLDILISFRTTYFNVKTGDEITNPKMIALSYLKGRFVIDFLAAIPLDLILLKFVEKQVSKKLQLFSMLKLLRVLRLGRIISYMNSTDDIKLSLKLFKMIFFLIMYLHCQACVWYYIVSYDSLWTPPFYLTNTYFYEFYEQSLTSRYWTSFYMSVQILYGTDINPINNVQITGLSFMLICSALINANIFGNITVIVSTINRKASRFQEQIDIANTAMKNMKLPEYLQRKVQDFMMYTQSNLDHQKELDMFLNMISPSLRLEVTQHIFLNAIAKNDIFRGSKDIIEFVVHNIITLLYLPEDQILRQGQNAHHLFFLARGDCEVWVRDQFKRDIFVRDLCQGQIFGEVALIAKTKRTATVKSKNYCTLAALNKDNFYELCQSFPDTFFRLKFATRNYQDKWKTFQKNLLTQIDYFQALSDQVIEELHYLLNLEYFEPNTDVFQQGNECKAIYFIVEGEIDLLIQESEGGNEVLLETLYSGCSIGSYSVLKGERYPYSARARNPLTLLVLEQEHLVDANEMIDEIEYSIYEAEEFIENNGVPLCDYKLFKNRFYVNKTPLQKFQNAVRRITVLNKRNVKSYKILQLLQLIQETLKQKKKFGKNQKTINAQNLPSFLRKNIDKRQKNKTFDKMGGTSSKSRDTRVMRGLTLKIENLTDHITRQNRYIKGMKDQFNKQLTRIVHHTLRNEHRKSNIDETSVLITDEDLKDQSMTFSDRLKIKKLSHDTSNGGEKQTFASQFSRNKRDQKRKSHIINARKNPNQDFNYLLPVKNNSSSVTSQDQKDQNSLSPPPLHKKQTSQDMNRQLHHLNQQNRQQQVFETGATISNQQNSILSNAQLITLNSLESVRSEVPIDRLNLGSKTYKHSRFKSINAFSDLQVITKDLNPIEVSFQEPQNIEKDDLNEESQQEKEPIAKEQIQSNNKQNTFHMFSTQDDDNTVVVQEQQKKKKRKSSNKLMNFNSQTVRSQPIKKEDKESPEFNKLNAINQNNRTLHSREPSNNTNISFDSSTQNLQQQQPQALSSNSPTRERGQIIRRRSSKSSQITQNNYKSKVTKNKTQNDKFERVGTKDLDFLMETSLNYSLDSKDSPSKKEKKVQFQFQDIVQNKKIDNNIIHEALVEEDLLSNDSVEVEPQPKQKRRNTIEKFQQIVDESDYYDEYYGEEDYEYEDSETPSPTKKSTIISKKSTIKKQ